MNRYYFYEFLLPNGTSRFGMTALPLLEITEARQWLEDRHQCIVTQLISMPEWSGVAYEVINRIFANQASSETLSGFLRDLAIMASSGVPIIDAIDSIKCDCQSDSTSALQNICQLLLRDLNSGSTLSVSVIQQGPLFPDTVKSMLIIGDATGTMPLMLLEAADHIDRLIDLKANVKQALIYPVISLIAIFLAAGFWMLYVMPKLMSLFKQLNAKLPPLTIQAIATVEWIGRNRYLVICTAIGSFLGVGWAWSKSLVFKKTVYELLHRMPASKALLTSSSMALFTEHLSILIRSGVDVISSFKLVNSTITDQYYKSRMIEVQRLLEVGNNIATSLNAVGGFPSMLIRMIKVGEESGSLDQQLQYLSAEYSKRLHRMVSNISEILRPLFVLISGGLLLLMIIILLMPVYDLISQTMGGLH